MILISHGQEEALFDDLSKKPFVYISDQEEYYVTDQNDGEVHVIGYKPLSNVFFIEENYIIKLDQKFKAFQSEVKSNRLIIAINLTLYLEEAITKFESLKSRFILTEYHDKKYLWRNDAKFARKSSIPEFNDIEHLFLLPNYTIEKIAPYFILQKKIVDDTISYLQSFLPLKQTRKYNFSYPYKYFVFDKLEHIGGDREIQKAKMEFFNEMAKEKYIPEADKKAAIDLFHDAFKNKIRWMGSKEELYYFIKTLIKYNIIKKTKRQTTTLISLSFCNSEGVDYQPQEFRALHDPNNTNRIDQIIAILKPASSRLRR